MKSLIQKYPVLSFFVVALLGMLLLNFSILYDYAYADAYESLWTGNNFDRYLNAFIVGGRPLYGLASVWIFGDLIHTLSDLKWLRLFSLVTSVAFASLFFHSLLKYDVLKRGEGMLLSFLILCVPSFTVFMGWSIIYEVPIGMSLAYGAGMLLVKPHARFSEWAWRWPLATVLVLAALCFYQASAMAFLIPFVWVAIKNRTFQWHIMTRSGVLLVLSFVWYYFLFAYMLQLYDVQAVERSHLDWAHLPKRFIGFYTREITALWHASGVIFLFGFFKTTGKLLLILFAVGMLYRLYRKKSSVWALLYIVFVLPLSYLPNLLSVDTWISARTLGPSSVLVLLLQFLVLQRLAMRHAVFKYSGIALAAMVMVVAGMNQHIGLAGLQAKEYKVLRAEVEKVLEMQPEQILVIRPDYAFATQVGYLPRYYLDEIGIVSSTRNWVSIPFINQIIKEERGITELKKSVNHPILSNSIPIGTYAREDTSYTMQKGVVLDMDKVLKRSFVQREQVVLE